MKKVLIFSLAYLPYHVSGAENAITEITDRIASDDIAFHMITARLSPQYVRDEVIGHVHIHRVGWGSAYLSKVLFIPLAALKAVSLHHRLRFDVSWAMMTYMLFPVVLARLLGVRIPYVLTLQDGDSYARVFERWYIRPFAPALDYGFRHAAIVQAISRFLATWPEKRGAHVPVELVYNGSNPRDIKDDVDPIAVTELREMLGTRPGDVWLVNTSRLVHQKGWDTALRAMVLLPSHVKLLAVGDGSDRRSLEELARSLGVADRVVFTGQVSRDDVTMYRRAADIFIAPSRSEGLGNAFLSALASRLPLITTGVGGIADYAIDGETAWIIPPNDPQALAATVQKVLAHPDEARAITARARRMVEERYDWDHIARDMRARVFSYALRGPIVHNADRIAAAVHATQERKTGGPYIMHPRAVARILADAGCDDVVIAAALVHDVLEDTPMTEAYLCRTLGTEVAGVVATLSENKSLPWEDRKRAYAQAVRAGSRTVQLISLADKIDNAHSLIAAHAREGNVVWGHFNRGREQKLLFEDMMLAVFRDTLVSPLVDEYAQLVAQLHTLA